MRQDQRGGAGRQQNDSRTTKSGHSMSGTLWRGLALAGAAAVIAPMIQRRLRHKDGSATKATADDIVVATPNGL